MIGAAITGGLIALVLLVFQAGSSNDADDGVAGSVATTFEIPAEGIGDHSESSLPEFNVTGVGESVVTADPEFLIRQLELAGVEVPDGATTEELMELVNESLSDGFIAVAP